MTSPNSACKNRKNSSSKSNSYLRAEGVAVGFGHGVTIGPAVLAVVCAVRWSPGLIVHGTVETLWDSILRKNISVEEDLKRSVQAQVVERMIN